MIKREFWENISKVWIRKKKKEEPRSSTGEVLPENPEEDYVDFNDIEAVDDFMKDILNDLF